MLCLKSNSLKSNSLKSNSNIFWLSLYIFFVLFGPKIGTLIDTGVIVSIIGILVIHFKKQKIIITENIILYLFLLCIICTYSLFIMFMNDEFHVVLVGRYIRCIISLYSIWCVVYHVNINGKIVNNCLINVLLIHAIIIILTTVVNPQWQHYIRWFNGYQKKIHELRSTGLLLGFDMAGLLCNIGLFLTAVSNYNRKNIIFMTIFIIAIFFTSRFSLITLIILMIFFIWYFRNDKTKKFQKIIFSFLIVLFSIPVSILLLITTSLGDRYLSKLYFYFSDLDKIINQLILSYSMTDVNDTFLGNFNFNRLNLTSLFFGGGTNANQDPGYTRIIYSIGILGLIICLIWYTKVLIDVIVRKMRLKKKRIFIRYSNEVLFLLKCMYLITLLLSFKNNYFFTTTFFEIFIIELVIFYKILSQERI